MRAAADRGSVLFAAVTFSQILEALQTQCADFEVELATMVEDYAWYRAEEKLLEGRNR